MLAKPDSFPNACFQYKNHHSTNASILTKLQGSSRPMGDLNTPETKLGKTYSVLTYHFSSGFIFEAASNFTAGISTSVALIN